MAKWEQVEAGIKQCSETGQYKIHTTAKCPYRGDIKHRRATLDEGATLDDARAKVRELKDEIARRPTVSRVTLSVLDYGEEWAEAKTSRLKPSVRNGYWRAVEVLSTYMGALPINEVVRADVASWVSHIEQMKKDDGTPYSTHTVRGWYRIAKIMFADAAADGHIDADPTLRVPPPTTEVVTVQERDTLSAWELGRLVASAKKHVPNRYAEIVTMAYTGMRSGEVYGLTWDCVKFREGLLIVRWAVSYRKLVRSTKTSAPREVPLPDIVAQALLEHRPNDWRAGDLVFPSDVGTPRGGDTLKRPLQKAARLSSEIPWRNIEVHVTPQVLRRTLNTLLIANGVDRIVQRSMMGHTSEQMTERYAGVRLEDKREAVLRLIEGGKTA